MQADRGHSLLSGRVAAVVSAGDQEAALLEGIWPDTRGAMPHVHVQRTSIETLAPDSAPRRPRAIISCFFLLCLAFVAVSPSTWGATNPLSSLTGKPADTQSPLPTATDLTDEGINESRMKLESRLEELHLQLLPDAVAALHRTYQDTASPQELEEWEKLTNRLAGILDNHINTLTRLKNIRKANRDRAVEIKRWQGFPEKPPYPLSLLDSLGDAIHAKEIDLQAQEVMRTTAEGEFDEFSGGLRNSRKQVRLAEENVEKSAGKPGERLSQWLLIMARLRDEVNQAGVVYAEARRVMLNEAQEGTRAEIDFLRQKLAVAMKKYRFSEEELKQKLQAIDDRRELLQRELDRAGSDAENARKSLDAAEIAVRKAQAEIASRHTSKVSLDRLLTEHERRQTLFNAADFRIQILRGMLHLLKNEKEIWQERYNLANGRWTQGNRTELKSRQDDLVILAKWKEYISSRRSILQVLIKSQQEKLSAATLPEMDREEVQSILVAYQAQETLLRRGDELLVEYGQLAQRRNEEAKHIQKEVTLAGRARGALATIYSLVSKTWYAELYVAEETIIVDNKAITRPRSVTTRQTGGGVYHSAGRVMGDTAPEEAVSMVRYQPAKIQHQ